MSENQSKQQFNPNQKPIGIVLSGGGGRALVHLGIWKALEEKGVYPQKISGVSMGGILGAMWAAGYSTDEIIQILKKEKIMKWIRPTWEENGLVSIQQFGRLFAKYLPKTFEELKTPFMLSAFCLQDAKVHYFESGDLITPLMATMSIPAVFAPIRIGKYDYVDSGLLENMPIRNFFPSNNMENESDYFIIGIHSNPLSENFIPTSTRSVIERYFQSLAVFTLKEEQKKCDLFLEPAAVADVKFSNLKIDIPFQIGYDYTIKYLNKFDIQSD